MLFKNSRHKDCQIKTVFIDRKQFYTSANPKAIDTAFQMAKLQHPAAVVEVMPLVLDNRICLEV